MVAGGRPAVFLDRDGVLNRSVVRGGRPYPPDSLEETEIMPGAPDAVGRLKGAGYVTVMVTNQPDVAKGKQTRDVVEAINGFVSRATGLDAVKVCWCLETEECDCYKPRPGMLLEAAEELSLDLSASYMIGDRWRDVGAGVNAGCRTIFIDLGYDESGPFQPDAVVASVGEAADLILEGRL